MKRRDPPTISVDDVQGLMKRFSSPVPFRETRTFLCRSIATQATQISPTKMVEGLSGDDLLALDSIDEANVLNGALVTSLWNRLTRHQRRDPPIYLNCVESRPTCESLSALALMRCQELDGFIETDLPPETSLVVM